MPDRVPLRGSAAFVVRGLEGEPAAHDGTRAATHQLLEQQVQSQRINAVEGPIPDVPQPTVPGWLLTHRIKCGVSRVELARRMGTTKAAVEQIELGQSQLRLNTVQRYMKALGYEFRITEDGFDWVLRP